MTGKSQGQSVRRVFWKPDCTRAAGKGFMRDMGRLTRAEAQKLAFLWGAILVDLS